jgi:hypothetical protein
MSGGNFSPVKRPESRLARRRKGKQRRHNADIRARLLDAERRLPENRDSIGVPVKRSALAP